MLISAREGNTDATQIQSNPLLLCIGHFLPGHPHDQLTYIFSLIWVSCSWYSDNAVIFRIGENGWSRRHEHSTAHLAMDSEHTVCRLPPDSPTILTHESKLLPCRKGVDKQTRQRMMSELNLSLNVVATFAYLSSSQKDSFMGETVNHAEHLMCYLVYC